MRMIMIIVFQGEPPSRQSKKFPDPLLYLIRRKPCHEGHGSFLFHLKLRSELSTSPVHCGCYSVSRRVNARGARKVSCRFGADVVRAGTGGESGQGSGPSCRCGGPWRASGVPPRTVSNAILLSAGRSFAV